MSDRIVTRRPQYGYERFAPTEGAKRLAETRTAELVRVYQFYQSHGFTPSSLPAPTLQDIVSSAYLQGVEDAAVHLKTGGTDER